MAGLGNITKIPTSGFTIPKWLSDNSVACEVGHGYVIKYESKCIRGLFSFDNIGFMFL
jgi:hypothetical protein